MFHRKQPTYSDCWPAEMARHHICRGMATILMSDSLRELNQRVFKRRDEATNRYFATCLALLTGLPLGNRSVTENSIRQALYFQDWIVRY